MKNLRDSLNESLSEDKYSDFMDVVKKVLSDAGIENTRYTIAQKYIRPKYTSDELENKKLRMPKLNKIVKALTSAGYKAEIDQYLETVKIDMGKIPTIK